MKNKKKVIAFGVAVAAFTSLMIASANLRSSLDSQNMAQRWSPDGTEFAQISVFFPDSSSKNYNVREAELLHECIENKMKQDSHKSKNEEADIFTDAYSSVISKSSVSIKDDYSFETQIGVMGVGGEFFLFHPLELLSGNYIYVDELRNDRVVLDEEAAWKLFYSTNVIGMKVYINGVEAEVAGVVRHEDNKHVNEIYPEQSLIYVHYSLLEQIGASTSLSAYEAVLPNPVDNYAKNIFLENYGVDTTSEVTDGKNPEDILDMVIIDNTKRYSASNLYAGLKKFGKNSAVSRPIAYPYWENAARNLNTWLTLLFLLLLITGAYIVITIIVFIAKLYLNRKWHLKPFIEMLTDKYTYKKRTRDYINIDIDSFDGKESRYE